METINYQLCFYVPDTHIEQVKQAVFAKGAGRIGQYDHCAWQTPGEGQFRPLPGANPTIGAQNEVETVREYKVEMICAATCLPAVIDALHAAHPYETPAYSVWPLENL